MLTVSCVCMFQKYWLQVRWIICRYSCRWMVLVMPESSCLAKLYAMINCSRFRCFCVLVVGAIFFLLLFINSFSGSSSLSVEPDSSTIHSRLLLDRSVRNGTLGTVGQEEDLSQTSDFVYDPSRDVLVFLHMQKTSGSVFGRHLIHNAIGFPATCYRLRGRKRRNCTDSNGYQWLFSRHSTGWTCGLHADWTELHACVPRALNRMEGVRRRRRCHIYCHFVNWFS